MPRNEYHDRLRQVPLFAELGRSELEVVGRAATELSFPEDHVVFHQGDVAHGMYILLDGSVTVTRDSGHIADIGSGGFVGEMALLTKCRRDATVTTTVPTTLLHIDGRSFFNLLRAAPHIAVNMLPIVAARAVDNLNREVERDVGSEDAAQI